MTSWCCLQELIGVTDDLASQAPNFPLFSVCILDSPGDPLRPSGATVTTLARPLRSLALLSHPTLPRSVCVRRETGGERGDLSLPPVFPSLLPPVFPPPLPPAPDTYTELTHRRARCEKCNFSFLSRHCVQRFLIPG